MISSTQPTTSNVSSSGIFDTTQHIQAQKAGIWPLVDLYPFTSFTFTNAAITGTTGPTRANCLASYNTVSNPWLNDTAHFNVVTTGYQLWTAPRTASYRVTSIGASGGDGNTGRGAGAKMIGVFTFIKGQKLKILVGQQGSTGVNACGGNKGGGGGGSFVVSEDNLTAYIVAAGGGGGSTIASGGTLGGTTSTLAGAGASSGGAAGSGGFGGGVNNSGCVGGASAGGGFTGNGSSGTDTGTSAGLSFINGGTGGNGGTQFGGTAAAGGFGGGGGGSSYMGGGAGGYSGGGGGGLSSCSCGSIGAGGGGGSINSGTSQTNTAAFNSTTHGSVLIEKL